MASKSESGDPKRGVGIWRDVVVLAPYFSLVLLPLFEYSRILWGTILVHTFSYLSNIYILKKADKN